MKRLRGADFSAFGSWIRSFKLVRGVESSFELVGELEVNLRDLKQASRI